MAVNITINGTTYSNPGQGDAPPWGTQIQSMFTALAAAVASTPSFMVTAAVSATPQAVTSGKTYLVNSASLAITLNLPTPAVNAWFWVVDVGFSAFTNNITLHRAATEKINNVSADFVIAQSGASWIFVSDGTNWYALASAGDLVLTDISDGHTYRVLTNSGVLSAIQVS